MTALPDARLDGRTALPEEAVLVQRQADAPLLRPSDARWGASVGVRPDASADAYPGLPALLPVAVADAGRSAVLAPVRAEAQAVPLDEPGPYTPDEVRSAERSIDAVALHPPEDAAFPTAVLPALPVR